VALTEAPFGSDRIEADLRLVDDDFGVPPSRDVAHPLAVVKSTPPLHGGDGGSGVTLRDDDVLPMRSVDLWSPVILAATAPRIAPPGTSPFRIDAIPTRHSDRSSHRIAVLPHPLPLPGRLRIDRSISVGITI
jgi:hypothetical protein